MIKTTTQIDLLQYAYNESDLADSDRIQRSIDGDPLVKKLFGKYINSLPFWMMVSFEPSEKSILNILAKAWSDKIKTGMFFRCFFFVL